MPYRSRIRVSSLLSQRSLKVGRPCKAICYLVIRNWNINTAPEDNLQGKATDVTLHTADAAV
jgi:hypothetical protein